MSESYCELCAPMSGDGAWKYKPFPRHAGNTVRASGYCYCGKLLQPGMHGYSGGLISPDEHSRTAVQSLMELQRWRHAATALALFPGSFNTPEDWQSKQLDLLITLVEKSRQYKRDAAEARDYVRRLVAPEGMHCWPDVVEEARKKLGEEARCCYCGKPGSNDNPLEPARPAVFPNQDLGLSEEAQAHRRCCTNTAKAAFEKLSPDVRKRVIENL